MFVHNKRLRYTVRVAAPNPGLANLLLEQFGGPQGELPGVPEFTNVYYNMSAGRSSVEVKTLASAINVAGPSLSATAKPVRCSAVQATRTGRRRIRAPRAPLHKRSLYVR
ncbi:manganese catalase family protein [Paraburkholderia sediminicola]|uniref:Manganese catalase family protein n=1 Tax=Paraburkholderia rhynchosiae TaxID=487049 RepID=A0ACC7NBL1_9BURK